MQNKNPSMLALWETFDQNSNCALYAGEDDPIYTLEEVEESLLLVLGIDPEKVTKDAQIARGMVYDLLSQACLNGCKQISEFRDKYMIDDNAFNYLMDVIATVAEVVPRYHFDRYENMVEGHNINLRQLKI